MVTYSQVSNTMFWLNLLTERLSGCKTILYQPETKAFDTNIKAFDTSMWLFCHEKFLAWNDAHASGTPECKLLTLKGNPGTGKTVLIKEAATQCSKEGNIVLRHHLTPQEPGKSFPHDRLHAFYCSVLFQLLELTSVQPRKFLQSWADEIKFQLEPSPSYWSKVRIKAAIHEILFSDTTSIYRIFVDALEACDSTLEEYFATQSVDLLEFIGETLRGSAQAGVDVRICLSRRHYPYHGEEEPETINIIVEDNIQHIVEEFIRTKLQDIKDRGARELVFRRLARHRIREFCWPQRVINQVRAARLSTHNGIMQIVEREFLVLELGVGSPGYGHESIGLEKDALNDLETIQLLQLATAARLPMATDEIRYALAFSGPRGPKDIRKWENSNDAWRPGEAFEGYIRQKSHGLLEVHSTMGNKRTIRFTHPAVEGLVQNSSISTSIQPSEWKQQSHFTLLKLCFGALEQCVDLFLKEGITFPFLEYAFEHWVYHARMTGKLIHLMKRLPRFLDSCIIKKAETIIERHMDFLLEYHETGLVQREELALTTLIAYDDSILVLLASHGCTDAVEHHLTRCNRCKSASQQLGEGQYRKAIDNAIIAGFPETAKWLLEHYKGRDVDVHRMEQTLLFRSCYRGYVDVVDVLLEKGANPTVPSLVPYDFPLHVAIEFAHEELILKLIDNAEEEIIRVKCQPFGKTALHVAIQSRNPRKLEVLRCLLDKIADRFPDIAEELVNIPDKAGKTSLQLVRDECARDASDADDLREEIAIFLGGRDDWCEEET